MTKYALKCTGMNDIVCTNENKLNVFFFHGWSPISHKVLQLSNCELCWSLYICRWNSHDEILLLSEIESLYAANSNEQYTIIPGGNSRGGMAMVGSNGHRYGIKMIKSNVTYWRCVVRNRLCNCRAVVIQRGNVFVPGTHGHCHSPNFTADAPND